MNIHIIGQKGIPSIGGGVEKHVEMLATRLVRRGNNVTIYTRSTYTAKNKTSYKGVNLISLPSMKKKHLEAISHTFLACLHLITQKPDIIHFHSIGPSSLIWLARVLKPRTKIIATFHCQDYYHQKWGFLARTYLRFGEFVACTLPNKTITVSKGLARYAKKTYNTDAIYIPNGVELMQSKNAHAIKKKWGLTKDSYILSVSRLIEHKGIHFLINAYNLLKTDKKLVIVGASSYTNEYVTYLKKIAQKNPNIIFTNNQTGSNLVELFSNAYLFVQPSKSEGLSIALLESLASKNTVLVSNIPENREAVLNNGFYFENKNVPSMKKQLDYLLKKPKLVKKYKEKGKQVVEENYDWDKITDKTERLYKNILTKQKYNIINFKTKNMMSKAL